MGQTPSVGGAAAGLRVDGRCWSVDLLENLLTLGHQAAIFRCCVAAAGLEPGHRLLDVGCGTGRLALLARRRCPQARVVGIDATPGMIRRARRNAEAAGLTAEFRAGLAERLEFPDASFEAVTSTFTFHHLPLGLKRAALAEMLRVLKPGGRLVVADYATPVGALGHLAAFPMRFDYHEYVRGHLRGELERLLDEQMGPVEVVRRFLGFIPVFRAVKH